LQKVFRLNRHPRFYIWTNRFPVSYLEGLEDLIQDPHKMLDEVNGRRFQVRRYLDEGTTLDCREPDRCKHCFIEPFCNTVDNVIEAQHEESWTTWWLDSPDESIPNPLPYGCTRVGVSAESFDSIKEIQIPENAGLTLRVDGAESPPSGTQLELIATTAPQLDAWLGQGLADNVTLRIELNQETGRWMVENRNLVESAIEHLHVHQPSHEKMTQAVEQDVRDPHTFFEALNLPIVTSGLPACMTPGATLADTPADLHSNLFNPENGRFEIRPLARYHVENRYRGKSVRCADCRLNDRCEGMPINMIRDQGLRQAQPLIDGDWADEAERQILERWPKPPPRVENGRDTQPVADSLPGFAQATQAPSDPLAVVAREIAERDAKRKARRAAIRAKMNQDS
jgi:hypothetical protein